MIIQISTVFSVLAFASTASIEYGNPLLHKDWVTDIPVITTGGKFDRKYLNVKND